MRYVRRFVLLAAFVASTPLFVEGVAAQDVVVGAPIHGIGDSFYESFNASGSWSNGNAFFNWGGGGVTPPFGNYDPNGDARLGFSVGGLNLGFSASQGSDRFSSSQTPMITLPNGGSGNFFNGSISPFVTGFVPVVGEDGGVYGGGSTMLQDRLSRLQGGERPTPLKPERLQTASIAEPALKLGRSDEPLNSLPASGSSAEIASAGVSAQRAAYLAEIGRENSTQDREFREALARAQDALAAGKAKLARAYFDQALRNAASDDQRREALAGLQASESSAR